MTVRFTSIAETELKQAIEFYEAAENGLGARLLDEVESAVERIAAYPEAWRQLSPRTRRCRTKRFPLGLFYQIRRDEVLILRDGSSSWSQQVGQVL